MKSTEVKQQDSIVPWLNVPVYLSFTFVFFSVLSLEGLVVAPESETKIVIIHYHEKNFNEMISGRFF